MSDPTVIVTIRQLPTGGYWAALAGRTEVLSAPDFGALLDKIRGSYAANEIGEDDVADERFERDLQETIEENRELLKRLAR